MQELQRTVRELAGKNGGDDTAVVKDVLDQLPHAAFVLRLPSREIVWSNRAVRRLLGYEPARLTGQNTSFLHPEGQYQAFGDRVLASIARRRAYRGRHWIQHGQGHLLPTEHLVTPVETIGGEPAVVSFVQPLCGAALAERFGRLTRREREVFGVTCDGCSAKTAARALGISHRTVEVHRTRMLEKLGATSVSELLAALLQAKTTFDT